MWLTTGVFSDCTLVGKILLFMFKKMTYEGTSVTARVSRTCLFGAFAGIRWPVYHGKSADGGLRNSRLSEP